MSGIGPISDYDFWKLDNPFREEEDDGDTNDDDRNDDDGNEDDPNDDD